MEDGAPQHIALCVKELIRRYFDDERIISWHFLASWSPRSPDSNSCVFLALMIPQAKSLP